MKEFTLTHRSLLVPEFVDDIDFTKNQVELLDKIKTLEIGTHCTVLETKKKKLTNVQWFKVSLDSGEIGWINGIALLR